MSRPVPEINIREGFVHVGEDKTIQIPIRDIDGAAQDLTGFSIVYWVTERESDTTPLIQMRTVDGDVFFTEDEDGVNSHLNLSFSDDDTMTGADVTVPAGRYYHSAKRNDADNEVVLFTGKIWITGSAAK